MNNVKAFLRHFLSVAKYIFLIPHLCLTYAIACIISSVIFKLKYSYIIQTKAFFATYLGNENYAILALAAIICLVMFLIACSPLALNIKSVTHKPKKLESTEFNFLLDAIKEVEDSARSVKKLPKKIHYYLTECDDINAYALGSNKIAVTRLLCEVITEDSSVTKKSIQGVIAHEFGHLGNRDYIKTGLINGGIYLTNIFVWMLNIAIFVASIALSMIPRVGNGAVAFANIFTRLIIPAFFFVNAMISNILFKLLSQKQEYEADYFGYKIGYGNELIFFLKFLDIYEKSLEGELGFFQRLKEKLTISTHPKTEKRIKKLESLTKASTIQQSKPQTQTANQQPI